MEQAPITKTTTTLTVNQKKLGIAGALAAATIATAVLLAPSGPNLYEIKLPPGDHGSINVGWYRNGATQLDPKVWLDDGDDNDPEPDDYEGVKFVGAGIDVTNLRCTSWDGITVAVGRHAGIVQLESLTLYAGSDKGAHFGEGNPGGFVTPEFELRLVNVRGVVPPPFEHWKREGKVQLGARGTGYKVGEILTVADGSGATMRVAEIEASTGAVRRVEKVSTGSYAQPPPFAQVATTSNGQGTGLLVTLGNRTKWLIFSYQADLFITGCDLNSKEAVEHTVYVHGFAQTGAIVEHTSFSGNGAEGFKVRSDDSETGWAGPATSIIIRFCTFRDWYQTWSWRGGAAIVCQGTASNIYVYRCIFYGGEQRADLPAYLRSKAVMVSSEGSSFAHGTGEVGGTGFGNGHVWIVECGMVSGPGTAPAWHNTMVRVGRNSGTQQAARSFKMLRCGAWGDGMIVAVGEVPAGKVSIANCNEPWIADYCRTKLGMDTTNELTFSTATRRVPISEGISR